MAINIAQLFVELGANAKGLQAAFQDAEKKFAKFGDSLTKAGRDLSFSITAPLAALGAVAIKSAISFESAFIGVTKTVEGTKEELATLRSGILKMSEAVPASSVELAKLAQTAGQLGIEASQIANFTQVMVELGEAADDLTPEQAATELAQFANITGMAQADVRRLSDSIVALGNQSATTEGRIIAMAQRIAGAGRILGLSEHQIVAFGTALAEVGLEADAGGTAISRIFIDMAQSVSRGGEQLDEFARVAGMAGVEFQQAFRDDAAGALVKFIQGLDRMQKAGEDVFGTLEKLGLTEVRVAQALLRLSGDSRRLVKDLEISAKAWQENTATATEAEKRFSSTESQLRILGNSITNVFQRLGDALLPAFQKLTEVVRGTVEIFGKLVDLFVAMPTTLQVLVGSLAALAAAIGPVILSIGLFVKALPTLITGVKGLGVAISFLAKHPLVALGIYLASAVLAFGAFSAGSKAAKADAEGFANAIEAAADKVRKAEEGLRSLDAMEKHLQEVIPRLKAEIAKITEAFARLDDRTKMQQGVELGFTGPLYHLQKALADAEAQLASLSREQVTAEVAAAKLNLSNEELSASLQLSGKRYEATQDLARLLNEEMSAYERHLEQILPLLGAQDPQVRAVAAAIEYLRGEQAKLNQAQGESAAKLDTSEIMKQHATAMRALGVEYSVFSDSNKKLAGDLDLTQAKLEATREAIRKMIEAASNKEGGLDLLAEDSGFQALIEQARMLGLEMEALEEKKTSFVESWKALGEELKVTGAEVVAALQGLFQGFADAVGNAVAQAIVYQADLGAALIGGLKQVAAQLISNLISLGIQQLISLLIGTQIAASRTATELASWSAITYAAAFAGSAALGPIGLAAAGGVAAGAVAAMLAGAVASASTGYGVGRAAVPALAEGGVITGPTLALVGEAGREMVLPLDRAHEFLDGGRGNVVTVLEADGRVITRVVAENLPGVVRRKIGNSV